MSTDHEAVVRRGDAEPADSPVLVWKLFTSKKLVDLTPSSQSERGLSPGEVAHEGLLAWKLISGLSQALPV